MFRRANVKGEQAKKMKNFFFYVNNYYNRLIYKFLFFVISCFYFDHYICIQTYNYISLII